MSCDAYDAWGGDSLGRRLAVKGQLIHTRRICSVTTSRCNGTGSRCQTPARIVNEAISTFVGDHGAGGLFRRPSRGKAPCSDAPPSSVFPQERRNEIATNWGNDREQNRMEASATSRKIKNLEDAYCVRDAGSRTCSRNEPRNFLFDQSQQIGCCVST